MDEEKVIREGDAPCSKCASHATKVKLTGYKESDGGDGFNWECEPGQSCPICGEPFLWLHEPSNLAEVESIDDNPV